MEPQNGAQFLVEFVGSTFVPDIAKVGVPRQKSPRPLAQRRIIAQVVQRLRPDLAPGREQCAPHCSLPATVVGEGHHGLEDPLCFALGLVPGVLVIQDDRYPLRRGDHFRRVRHADQEPRKLRIGHGAIRALGRRRKAPQERCMGFRE